MATTQNLDLYVTPSTDSTTTVREWIDRMAASDMDSNMQKIDAAYKELKDQCDTIPTVASDLSGAEAGQAADAQKTKEELDRLEQLIGHTGGGNIPVGDRVDEVKDGDLLYAKRGEVGISIPVEVLKEYIVGDIDITTLPDGDGVEY